MRRLVVIVCVVIVAVLADLLYEANETVALGAGGILFAIGAVILWRTLKLRYVTAGFVLAALCSFGMCGLRLYDNKSWIGVVLAVLMLTGLFGPLGIEERRDKGSGRSRNGEVETGIVPRSLEKEANTHEER